jgi:hypothetical protein
VRPVQRDGPSPARVRAVTDCTCDVRPPQTYSAQGGQYGKAIYVDTVEENTTTDPACPFHGERGTMVVRWPVACKPCGGTGRLPRGYAP